jgi:dUTP pyrophosphatase
MCKKQFTIKVVEQQNKHFYENHSTFHEGDAGLDLYTVEDTMILPGETKLVDLGIQCQSKSFNWCVWNWMKGNFYKYHSYLLLPRSSISKTPLIMHNSIGLIDSGYLGNLKLPFYNTSTDPFLVERGTRYAQLVNGNLSSVSFKLVEDHRRTDRGSNGLGSTGQ